MVALPQDDPNPFRGTAAGRARHPDPDEEVALALYQALRAQGSARVGEAIAGLDDEQAGRAWRRLQVLGLVQIADGVGEAVEPDSAMVRAVASFHESAAQQVRNAEALHRVAHSVATVYRPAVAREATKVAVEYLRTPREKIRALAALDAAVTTTNDSLHPGPMPPMPVLEESLRWDRKTVERGVRLRAIYPMSLLQTAKFTRYLHDLAAAGAQVRLIDHAPYDLLILDRHVAVLPANPDSPSDSMVVLRGSALVRVQVALYEDYWLRAVPLLEASAPGTAAATELSAQEQVIIRLMASGLTDDQIARKIGVHRRTVQRAVTKLLERLNASSRFEAGLKLAQNSAFSRAVRLG